MTDFPHHAFREYDIRGIAGSDITEPLAYKLGKAYAAMLPATESRPVIVGRDVRLSGLGLQTAVIRGLHDAGLDVIDVGIVPTPLAYYAVYQLEAAGSVQITASHNPGEYNGFKMMIGKSSLHGDDIQQLKQLMLQDHDNAEKPGTTVKKSIAEQYIDFVVNDCPLTRPMKVVIDAGNGPSGLIAAPLYRRLGCEVIELYCEPDGTFPNHHPDPTIAANLADMARTVIEQKADLGIAFDGDGDRIGIVDEQGEIIWSDMLLLLLARQLLQEKPGATIISEVKCSQHMYDGIRKAGGKPVMWRTGHSPIKAKMKETGALLAGEMSGHMFFADRFFGFDDAAYAGARVMQLLTESGSTFSQLLADVPYSESTPEMRIECSDERKFALVEEARVHFSALCYDIIDIDGMRIQFEDGWGLLRASNTQPAMVLRFEAPNKKRLAEMRCLIENWLDNHQ
ncbi:phosphomannomutase / phosphoglucomutase [Mariprofundus micogutta]|uniref:Phosphomannomutase / phosphoglucomutase n=1 Tax=Mariprofundus micogutta TaxID=1921010 RepID=A0A1L8CJM1_9PROT|nr:phosphomannomutase/phosphoglucomutase [Mariprofundus micogutta]GAV19091.1 phosphomannomutase / phosphoglucomutase [Mariprofundus micogutta]